MISRRKFLASAGIGAAAALAAPRSLRVIDAAVGAPPNVLIIMADDCTYNDLKVYGGKNAVTPNLDRLASEGMVFNRAYLTSAMCQPCRAELYTGLYPMRNGCAWNHSASRPEVTSMPHHLSALGYRVGRAGKVHVDPETAFPFEKVAGFDENAVRNPTRAHDLEGIREFMSGPAGQPFSLVVALVEPHVPWVMGDTTKFPTEKIKLPPNVADTPQTREDFAAYLAEITYMDGQVGEILEVLEASGAADNTLVLFTSEQGSQWPGNKWTNWDTGLHTALFARWPGKVKAGQRTDALVQYADVLPTLVEMAGGTTSEHDYDGRSLLPVLLGQESKHREFAYGLHNNLPEGPAYPIRTVSDGAYRYIRNLRPDEIYIEKHLMGWRGEGALNNPYWATWIRETGESTHTYDLVKRYMKRPAEELYHTAADPFEFSNLSNDPAAAKIKARLSTELDRWMYEQGDPGAPVDTPEALEAARRGEHMHGTKVKL